MAMIGVGIGMGIDVVGGAGAAAGRTHYSLDGIDLQTLRVIRSRAVEGIEDMRKDLAEAEAELAVLDEALTELDAALKANADTPPPES